MNKTIQANELRIGNWVKLFDTDRFYKVHLVCKTAVQVEGELIGGEVFKLENIQPIELTPDILEKAGFEYDASYDVPKIQKGNLVLWGYDNEFGANFGHNTQLDVNVKYLHELQNLYFVLCGEELTISLTS